MNSNDRQSEHSGGSDGSQLIRPGSESQIPWTQWDDRQEASRQVAVEIAELIRSKAASGERAILGLATGTTPLALYAELIRLHRTEGLSFRGVETFNLDEYEGLEVQDPQSFRHFMQRELFGSIDLPEQQVHFLPGVYPPEQAASRAAEYERELQAVGGIDLQVLGLGRNGHIGFNEPGSPRDSRTRRVTLHGMTREDMAPAFTGRELPTHALSMGVGTLLEARRIRLLAFGPKKATVVERAVRGVPDSTCPASFLQGHLDVQFLLDAQASSALCSPGA